MEKYTKTKLASCSNIQPLGLGEPYQSLLNRWAGVLVIDCHFVDSQGLGVMTRRSIPFLHDPNTLACRGRTGLNESLVQILLYVFLESELLIARHIVEESQGENF